MFGATVRDSAEKNPPDQRLLCIVDDDDAVRDAVALLLRTHGFAMRSHSSAPELLADPKIDVYACLVLDMHMPAMTGLEALETLRSRHIRTPAIILTGLVQPALADRIAAAGATLLQKPVSEEDLLCAVAKACSRGRAGGHATGNT